jgi:hypothetical protein
MMRQRRDRLFWAADNPVVQQAVALLKTERTGCRLDDWPVINSSSYAVIQSIFDSRAHVPCWNGRDLNPEKETTMKPSRIILVSTEVLFALASTRAALAAEDPAKDLAKAPAAIQASAKQLLGEKKLEEFDKESLDGKTTYEIGFKVGDVDHSYILDESGKLIQEEADIATDKLPAAVTDAIKKAQPKGEVSEAADATANGNHFFVVDVNVDKVHHVLSVKADGALIADQIEKAADDVKE